MPQQTPQKMKRNVVLLALSQAMLITGTSLMLASCALVAMTLTSTKALATLPLALLFLAQMATTIPASLYMQRVGRRPGFMTSSVFGMAGVLLLGMCVGINFTGTTVIHFWGALIFLGLGWNFLFVGATTQLTETYRPNEKARAQALNDFIVFSTVSLTSLSSGAVQNILGWQIINMAVIPFLVLIALANLWLRGKSGPRVQTL